MSPVARMRPLWFGLSWLIIVTLLLPPGLVVAQPAALRPVRHDPAPASTAGGPLEAPPTPGMTAIPEVTPSLPLTPTATPTPELTPTLP
ncbi:MAG TPA: hypothetical protein PKH77_17455, partial [Anaerolineae bacterium]|nr:hypothetical protein [Anaerolineae bacterium]